MRVDQSIEYLPSAEWCGITDAQHTHVKNQWAELETKVQTLQGDINKYVPYQPLT